MNYSILLLCCINLLSSCSVSKQVALPISEDTFEPEILTIILKITKEEQDTFITIKVDQKITAKGFLKKHTFINAPKKEGCIIAVFQNMDKKTVETIILANPLEKSYEFIDEQGNFQRKNVVLKEDYLSLRIQKKPNIAFLNIYTLKEGKQLLLESITF